jgi:beta-xylosidase
MPPTSPENDATLPAPCQGDQVLIFDTRSFRGAEHAVNDHCLFQGPGGEWHLFGIFQEQARWSDDLVVFIHGVAAALSADQGLTSLVFEPAPAPFALERDTGIGETHLWAPHVVEHCGRYFMFYQGGGPDDDRASLRVAESRDLHSWTRIGTAPLFEDFSVARDPMILRAGDDWVMYYTRCDDRGSRLSGVAYRTSRDLRCWSEPKMAFVKRDSPPLFNSGYTESPFVFERGGWYYLSVTSYPIDWVATFLYRSRTPFCFEGPPVARLRAHAAEWITDPRSGDLHMTHAGPGQGGVWLMPVSGL